MKVQVTLEFSDEERMALGIGDNRATRTELVAWVSGQIDKQRDSLLRMYYRKKRDEFERKANEVEE